MIVIYFIPTPFFGLIRVCHIIFMYSIYIKVVFNVFNFIVRFEVSYIKVDFFPKKFLYNPIFFKCAVFKATEQEIRWSKFLYFKFF